MAKSGDETVTVSVRGTKDRVGDWTKGAEKFTVHNAIIWPRESPQNPGVIIEGYNVFLPGRLPAAVVGTDVVDARGKTWAIDGDPGDYRKRGAEVGTLLVVKRLT